MLGDIGLILAGFLLLVWGADRLVLGAGASARNLGISPLLIGLTIVAFATSAPEIIVSVVSALQGSTALAIGNALGSNIANVGLVLGAAALVRPMDVKSETLSREMPALLAVTLLTLMLFLDRYLGRVDGVVLLGGLGLLLYWIVSLGIKSEAGDPIRAEYEAEIRADLSMRASVAWLVVGLIVLLIGAELLVHGASALARDLGVTELVVGLTVVAIGTSLPEMAVSIVSAMKGEHGLAIGNIIGSNMFNLLAVIGIAGVIHPAEVADSVLGLHFPVMIGLTLVLFAMAYTFGGAQGRINRAEGIALLLSYTAYLAYIIKKTL